VKKSYTILYVDDDIDDLLLISEAFQKYTDHLTVIHASNGVEGLKCLNKFLQQGKLPCLVILDINMPVMNGKEMRRNSENRLIGICR
jgi:CheY-like chemotaxis protein